MHDVDMIAEAIPSFGMDSSKLSEFIQYAREDVNLDPMVPVRFQARPEAILEIAYSDKTSEIIALARQLIEIPSVTACPEERLEEINRAGVFIYDYLRNHGVEMRYYNQAKYPAVLAGFPQQMDAPVMLCGHFDVVPPEPDDSQFIPRVEGDYLWGRGAADMKTVVATCLVWMKDMIHRGEPYPPINLLLVGNEENGETEPMGTPHVLNLLEETGYIPKIMIAGERTGERGNELWGEICTQNRGVMRFEVLARGQKGHSGTSGGQADLTERLMVARLEISQVLAKHLTLTSEDGWQSQARFPFIQVGTPGVYNITPDLGSLGLEVRPIPQDDISQLIADLERYCQDQNLELRIQVKEGGIACDPENPYLRGLIDAAQRVSGDEPKLGKKLAGTSARFAPQGQGVVWGQSGLGAHAKDERHFIPSILPYYQVLDEYARILLTV
jgi:succinyl-diaminopimelate desuccinylase